MRVSFEMTLDGMVRALRLKAHGVAEEAQDRYHRGRLREAAGRDRAGEDEAEGDDDRAGD